MTLCKTAEEARQMPRRSEEGVTQLNRNLCYKHEEKTVCLLCSKRWKGAYILTLPPQEEDVEEVAELFCSKVMDQIDEGWFCSVVLSSCAGG